MYETSALLIKHHIYLHIDYIPTDYNFLPTASAGPRLSPRLLANKVLLDVCGGDFVIEQHVEVYECLSLLRDPVDIPSRNPS